MALISKQNALAGRMTIGGGHFAPISLPFRRLEGEIYEFAAYRSFAVCIFFSSRLKIGRIDPMLDMGAGLRFVQGALTGNLVVYVIGMIRLHVDKA